MSEYISLLKQSAILCVFLGLTLFTLVSGVTTSAITFSLAFSDSFREFPNSDSHQLRVTQSLRRTSWSLVVTVFLASSLFRWKRNQQSHSKQVSHGALHNIFQSIPTRALPLLALSAIMLCLLLVTIDLCAQTADFGDMSMLPGLFLVPVLHFVVTLSAMVLGAGQQRVARLGPDFGFDADARVLRNDNFLYILAKVAFSAIVVWCWWVNGRQQTAHQAVHLVLAATVFSLPHVLVAAGTAVGPRFLREGRKEHDHEGEEEAVLEAGGKTAIDGSLDVPRPTAVPSILQQTPDAALLLVGLAGAVAVMASVLVGFCTPRGAAPAVSDLFEDLRVTATTAALLCLHAGMRLSSVGALVNLVTEKSGGPSSAVYGMVSALVGTHFAQRLQVRFFGPSSPTPMTGVAGGCGWLITAEVALLLLQASREPSNAIMLCITASMLQIPLAMLLRMGVMLLRVLHNTICPQWTQLVDFNAANLENVMTGVAYCAVPNPEARPGIFYCNIGHMELPHGNADRSAALRTTMNILGEYASDPAMAKREGYVGNVVCEFLTPAPSRGLDHLPEDGIDLRLQRGGPFGRWIASWVKSNVRHFNFSAWESAADAHTWAAKNTAHRDIVNQYHHRDLTTFSALIGGLEPVEKIKYHVRCQKCRRMVYKYPEVTVCSTCRTPVKSMPLF